MTATATHLQQTISHAQTKWLKEWLTLFPQSDRLPSQKSARLIFIPLQ